MGYQGSSTQPRTLTLTPTISTSAYAANDVVGGLLTFYSGSAVRGGILNSIVIADKDNEKSAFTLYLFNEAPLTIADNVAFAPATTDVQKIVAVVSIASTDYTTITNSDSNSDAYAYKSDLNHVFSGSALYGYLVTPTGSTPTYTATTDLIIRLNLLLEM